MIKTLRSLINYMRAVLQRMARNGKQGEMTEDPFKPVLCMDASEDSKLAFQILQAANISFDLWDATQQAPSDLPPPFVVRGKRIFYGPEAIDAFAHLYSRVRTVERARRPHA